MGAHRQSALLLHGLAGADQRWILARLAPEDRARLSDHLAELQALRIAPEPALAAAISAPQAGGARARLMAASAEDMAALLAAEPVWMLKQVLALGPWPWQAAFVALLTPERRALLEAAALPQVRPAVTEGLLERCAQLLGTPPASLQAVRGAGAMAALRSALARWR